MDFVNETKMEAGWTMGFEADGRELLIVVVKGTFTIPADGSEPTRAEQQVPIVMADEFVGEPGFSAIRYEADYAHRKPACDVLLNGTAYAPERRPSYQVPVGLGVGPIRKVFNVNGDRVWDKTMIRFAATDPKPFVQLPIDYGRAFGGVDSDASNPEKKATYPKNPVGIGYYPLTKRSDLAGRALPNTEDIKNPVTNPQGNFMPMSFGVVGRNFESRARFAGTYDDAWLARRAPFWPSDFDYRYFQAAAPDQQMPYPTGGEWVVLRNLTPDGLRRFQIPIIPMPVLFIPYQGRDHQVEAVIDTILIEPDQDRFTLTWRASYPVRKSCFDMSEVIAGEMPPAWHRARRFGDKPYYRSLGELVKARRRPDPTQATE